MALSCKLYRTINPNKFRTNMNYRTFAGIFFTSVLLCNGLADQAFTQSKTLKSLWSIGFGTVNLTTLVHIGAYYNPTLLSSTLLANTPQLILSMLYFSYNSIFTCEMVGREWNNFGRHRQPLRVTWPRGEQKSTYWLSLPYQYGLPLMGVATLLHWLISRAFFLVNIQFINPLQAANINTGYFRNGDQQFLSTSITQCGWSPIAVIISILLASLVFIVGLLFGFRRYHAGPPLVGSCSAAIAAACHCEPDEDKDIVLEPLMWGVTSRGDGVSHCTFSAREVEWPDKTDLYR